MSEASLPREVTATSLAWTSALRRSECLFLAYFAYVVVITPLFPDRPNLGAKPVLEFLFVFVLLAGLARASTVERWQRTVNTVRDWLPVFVILLAFREMEWFLPRGYPHRYEAGWVQQDRTVLSIWGVQNAIESLGPVIPFYLESCYLLTYGLAPACLGILYFQRKRRRVDTFLTVYLLGTLVSYSLFPFFPSQPPRILFPTGDLPHISTWMRRLNLFILSKGTIHIGVFPSAHVSSAFSAAWGLFATIWERKRWGCFILIYAFSVSVATVYGRYHYSADVIGGFAVSLLAGLVALVIARGPGDGLEPRNQAPVTIASDQTASNKDSGAAPSAPNQSKSS